MGTVLITGGLGVLGAWVTRKMVEEKVDVVTYSRHIDTMLTKDIMDKIKCATGDILDLPTLISTIKRYNADRIIHMATVLPETLDANLYMGWRSNVEGTINVLEAARLTDVKRVVYTSTKGVYPAATGEYDHPTYKLMDEDFPKNPTGIYGASKFFAENMASAYNRIYGVDVMMTRFSLTYGPGKQIRHGALAILSKIIESAMLGKPLHIPKGGDQLMDVVYCKDIANGLFLACFAGKTEHRIFNIAGGKGESFRVLMEILKKMYPGAELEIGPGLDKLGTSGGVLSIERARKELGYEPVYNMERAAKDYVASMKMLGIEPIAG